MLRVGLDGNRPIDPITGAISPTVMPEVMRSTLTPVLRLNFVLGPGRSVHDPEWLAAYDQIIDGLLANDVQVYGLISHEAVASPLHDQLQHPPSQTDERPGLAWVSEYVDNFAAIVARFGDRVRVFESFNEPNNWWGDRPWVHPYWFAYMLSALYRRIKGEDGRQDVTLVSGPLLAHNNHGIEDGYSMGTFYLEDTYRAGKLLDWNEVRRELGGYPLDGLGCHIYVCQRPDATLEEVRDALRRYVTALTNALRRQDPNPGKKLYISEFGWDSHTSEQLQAERLMAGFDVLRNDARVALAVWYCTIDYPEPGQPDGWRRQGLYDGTGGLGRPKLAHAAFREVAQIERGTQPQMPEPVDGFDFPLGKPGASRPVGYRVTLDFCDPAYYKNFGAWHPGVDWQSVNGPEAALGDPVWATAHGRVTKTGYFAGGWGNIVLIEHRLGDDRTIWSQYARLDQVLVEEGQVVRRGQQIGTVGKGPGNRFPALLHFEIRQKELPANSWGPIVYDKERTLAAYLNPVAFVRSNRPDGTVPTLPIGREIILDTEAGDKTVGVFTRKESPYWWRAPFGYQGSTLWTYAAQWNEDVWGEWRPNLEVAGDYEVYVFVPKDYATTRQARYRITHAAGSDEVVVNQNRYYDQWVLLGRFPFAAGSEGAVRLSDLTGEPWQKLHKVAFDAVKWVLVGESSSEAVLAGQAAAGHRAGRKSRSVAAAITAQAGHDSPACS